MCLNYDYSLLFEILDGKGDCYVFPCDCSGNVDPSFLANSKFEDKLFRECQNGKVGRYTVNTPVIREGLHLRLDD